MQTKKNDIRLVGDSDLVVIKSCKRIADIRQRAKLNTAVDIRKEMSKLYRETRSGLLDIQDSTRLVWILASIAKVIESAEMETRLKALEEDL
jgi:hypothetical protein